MLIAIFIIIICLAILKGIEDSEKEETERVIMYQNQEIFNSNNYDNDNFKCDVIKQLKSINENLIYLQNAQEKQNKKLENIEKNVGCITTILIIPIIIGIISIVLSISAGYGILEWFSEFMQTF